MLLRVDIRLQGACIACVWFSLTLDVKMEDVPPQDTLVTLLANTEAPLAARMRAVFYLKSAGGAVAVDSLGKGTRQRVFCVLVVTAAHLCASWWLAAWL